ncbi:Hypothetical_protein [Hexamita inflata]|uniref:Hypothetical_protein n=1 Tax=Hexamita inflata TaxID=28002 RepID=A0AA86QW63_9EUKA|nr:Hypothetical protein HINF_LOCUS48144 [Hexamita inflata]
MISTGYAIMTIEEQKCNILTQNNIKFDEQNLLKLLVTREQAITIGMKINDQRYEVYQYEKKDGELQIQGRTQSMESGFAVVVIDKHHILRLSIISSFLHQMGQRAIDLSYEEMKNSYDQLQDINT